MSNGVEFEEDKYGLGGQVRAQQRFTGSANPSSSKMAQWLVNKGWVKSDSGAQVILVGIVIINIVITFFVIKYFL